MAERPQPAPDPLTRPFWDAARTDRLVLQRCRRCDRVVFPPLSHCPRCHRATLEWAAHPNVGTVHSLARTHLTVVEGIEAPYTTVDVEIDGSNGVHLVGFLASPDAVIGDRVQLRFVDVDGTPTATFFRCDAPPERS